MDLEKQFMLSVNLVNNFTKKPSDNELLELYGLYKQSTVGNVNISKPSFFNFKDCSKWNAWNSKKGFSQRNSMKKYVKLVNNLKESYSN